MSLLEEKQYPHQYPNDAVKILSTMSFSEGKHIRIIGSQSLKSQLYAGDYDANEPVRVNYPTDDEALIHLVKEFQAIIRRLQKLPNVYIGDIKSGVIEDWKVIDSSNPKQKVESLFQSNIISAKEAKEALRLITTSPAKAKQEVKFHIIRWTPKDVLKGYQTLRDGASYSLKDAFHSPTITKLDVIGLVSGRYTEFSIIYEFYNNGKVLNEVVIDPEESIKESIELYKQEGNRFKVIKRKFSLAKLHNNKKELERYNTILNSEAGKIYVLYSDVKTLVGLLESQTLPKIKLREAIRNFTKRLNTIYKSEIHLRHQKDILLMLDEALQSKHPIIPLRRIEGRLFQYLNRSTKLRGGFAPTDPPNE
jgi:hypothetical protein